MKFRWLFAWCLGEITILSRLAAKHTPYLVTMFRPDAAWSRRRGGLRVTTGNEEET